MSRTSPRSLAIRAGALGIFGVGVYSLALLAPEAAGGLPRPTSLHFLLASALLAAGAVPLWRAQANGWWLVWWGVLFAGASGLLPSWGDGIGMPSYEFRAGLMLTGAGFLFADLSSREVYEKCFAASRRPGAALLAIPLWLSAGGTGVWLFDPLGRYAAAVLCIMLLVSKRGLVMTRPLLAGRGSRQEAG